MAKQSIHLTNGAVLTLALGAGFEGNGAVTIEFMLKRGVSDSPSTYRNMVGFGYAGGSAFELAFGQGRFGISMRGDQQLDAYANNFQKALPVAGDGYVMPKGEWVRFSATLSWGAGGATLTRYRNGVQIGQAVEVDPYTYPGIGWVLTIGDAYDMAGTTDLYVADLRAYKDVRSGTEVGTWDDKLLDTTEAPDSGDTHLIGNWQTAKAIAAGKLAADYGAGYNGSGTDLTVTGDVTLSGDIPDFMVSVPEDAPVVTEGATSSSSLTANWTAVDGATGYDFELNGVVTSLGNVLTRTATGLSASTAYTVRVRGKNVGGPGPWSDAVVITTDDPPSMPPAAPTGLNYSNLTATGVDLAWTASADADSYRAKTAAGVLLLDDITGTSAHVPLAALTPYEIVVHAVNSAGESGASNSVEITTPLGENALEVIALPRGVSFIVHLDEIGPGTWDTYDTVPLSWRLAGDTTWIPFNPLDHVRAPDGEADPQQVAGMLWGFTAGDELEYAIDFSAFDGYPDTLITGSVTLPPEDSTGTDATVHAIPFGTADYAAAIAAAMGAVGSKPGHTVEIEGGLRGDGVTPALIRKSLIPYNNAWAWSGTAEAWVKLRAKAGTTPVFDGSDPVWDCRDGVDTVDGAGTARELNSLWEPVPPGEYTDPGYTYSDAFGNNIVVAARTYTLTADDKIYRTKAARAHPGHLWYEKELDGDAWRLQDTGQGIATQDANGNIVPLTGLGTLMDRGRSNDYGGYVIHTDGKLYVRLHEGQDARHVWFKFPTLTEFFNIGAASHVHVDGIRFQYFAGVNGGCVIAGAAHDCLFTNLQGKGLQRYWGPASDSTGSHDLIVKGCSFGDRGLFPWWTGSAWKGPVWAWGKTPAREDDTIIGYPQKGFSLLNSVLMGVRNGYSPASSVFAQRPIGHYVDENVWIGIGDDAFEPETSLTNVKFTRNLLTECFSTLSFAEAAYGPVYCDRNVILMNGGYGEVPGGYAGLTTKLGRILAADTASKHIHHNTFIATGFSNIEAWGYGVEGAGGSRWVFFKNNIVAADGIMIGAGPWQPGYPHVFDGNVYFWAKHNQVDPVLGAGWSGLFATYQSVPPQGDGTNSQRRHATFADFQKGHDTAVGGRDLPGADGTVHMDPVDAMSPGVNGPVTRCVWLHDPRGVCVLGTHDLRDVESGDYRPAADSAAIGVPVALNGFNQNCGTGWTAYNEETLTAGAMPVSAPAPPNTAPTLTPAAAPTGLTEGDTFELLWECQDAEGGAMDYTVSIPAKPAGSALATGGLTVTKPSGAGTVTVEGTADKAGAYTVQLRAEDAGGLSTTSSITFTVAAGAGQSNTVPAVSMGSVTPESPVVGDTVSVAYTYTDPDTGDTHTAAATLTAKPGGSAATAEATHAEGEGGDGYWTADRAGVYTVRVDVNDGTVTGTASKTVTVASGPDVTPPTPGAVNVLAVTATSITVAVNAGTDDGGIVSRVLTLYLDADRTQEAADAVNATIGVNVLAAPLADTSYYGRVVFTDAEGNASYTDFQTRTLPASQPAGDDDGSAVDSLLLPVRFQRGRPVNVGWQPVQLHARLGDTRPPVTVLFVAMDGVTPLNVSGATARLLWRVRGTSATAGFTDGAAVQGHADRMAFDFPSPAAPGSYELLAQLTTDGGTETCLDAIWLLVSA